MIAVKPLEERIAEVRPPTYPARPMSGGSFDKSPLIPPGEWCYTPKLNGWRVLVDSNYGTMWNRKGERLSIEDEFRDALQDLCEFGVLAGIEWWDCEALERRHNIGKGSLIVLDYIATGVPFSERASFVSCYIPELDLSPSVQEFPTVSQVPLVDPGCWNDLKQINKSLGCDFYEGLVAKRANSPYPIQLTSPEAVATSWIKYRWHW